MRVDFITLINKKDLNNAHRVIEKLGERYGWSEHTWLVDDRGNIKAHYKDAAEVERTIQEEE